MANGLIPVDFNNLPAAPVVDDGVFDDMSKGADFLHRLQLFGKGKMIDTGKIKPGHYGIPLAGGDVIDLGNRVDVLPIAWRPN